MNAIESDISYYKISDHYASYKSYVAIDAVVCKWQDDQNSGSQRLEKSDAHGETKPETRSLGRGPRSTIPTVYRGSDL